MFDNMKKTQSCLIFATKRNSFDMCKSFPNGEKENFMGAGKLVVKALSYCAEGSGFASPYRNFLFTF